MAKQKSVSGSITGSPKNTAAMLDFCKRHQILPEVEFMKFSEVEKALQKLESGQAKYRIVLKNDLE